MPCAVSIIIVNWNTREMTCACIASLPRSGAAQEMQVILVDNASTDGSAEAIRTRFPHVQVIQNTENRGFAAANNQAFRIARGDYVLLLNSDTLVLDNVIENSVKYMQANPNVGVMGCRVLNADRTVQPTCSRAPSFTNLFLLTSGMSRLPWPRFVDRYQMRRWNRRRERDVEVVSGCYMLVRRKTIDEVGLLDESFFFFGEETDWCKRFRKAGWALRFAPIGEIIHYGGGSAKKLNHRRDLMLTEALVRYHRKHSGLFGAAAVWGQLALFNLSRWAYWTVRAWVDSRACERRDHFRGVMHGFRRVWSASSGAVV